MAVDKDLMFNIHFCKLILFKNNFGPIEGQGTSIILS